MTSRIRKPIHKFWQTMAIFIGIFLALEGVVTIVILDLTLLMLFFAILRIAIGVGTVIVDGWFLAHI